MGIDVVGKRREGNKVEVLEIELAGNFREFIIIKFEGSYANDSGFQPSFKTLDDFSMPLIGQKDRDEGDAGGEGGEEKE